jgi:hypothetical protein
VIWAFSTLYLFLWRTRLRITLYSNTKSDRQHRLYNFAQCNPIPHLDILTLFYILKLPEYSIIAPICLSNSGSHSPYILIAFEHKFPKTFFLQFSLTTGIHNSNSMRDLIQLYICLCEFLCRVCGKQCGK